MNRRRIRIARMQTQRNTHGFPGATGKLGTMRARRSGQLIAGDVREQDTAALEHVALLDQPRYATAAFVARPGIATKLRALDRFETRDDAVLQAKQIVAAG